MYKVCKVCEICKEFSEFRSSNRHKDGYLNECRECVKIKRRKYYIDNYEKSKENNKRYYEKNKKKINESIDKNKKKENNKRYIDKNKDKLREKYRIYYLNNRERIKCKSIEYYEKNKSWINKSTSRKNKIRRKSYIKRKYQYIWRNILSRTINQMKLNKNQTTFELLGYDYNSLKENIENKFEEGMSWDNHGEWHLDHIIPISKFKEGTPPNVVNKLENLRPVWAKENLSKFNKIIDTENKLFSELYDYLIIF